MVNTDIFLTSLGAGQYQEVQYSLGGRRYRTRFAPVATARALGLSGRALVLVTRTARERWFSDLEAELSAAGLQPEPVEIPDGRNENEILSIFSRIAGVVPENARVVVDVTFALRHLPFVYLASLAYLTGLRGVHVNGIYYGAFELKSQTGGAPILNITSLFELLQWYQALEAFRITGRALPLAQRLQDTVARMFRLKRGERSLSAAKDNARRLAAACACGLPIEAGISAGALLDRLQSLGNAFSAPHAALAVQHLAQVVAPWAMSGVDDKQQVSLAREELERQLAMVDWYLDRHDVANALELLREWLVSAAILARGDTTRWLDYGSCRKPMENLLNACDYRAQHGVGGELEKDLGALWSAVADRRNKIAHSGMAEDAVWLHPETVRSLAGEARALLDPLLKRGLGRGRGELLVTPLGHSHGVLFSALHHVKADDLVIVTSAEVSAQLGELMKRCGRSDLNPLVLTLRDPHTGFREQVIDKQLRAKLAASGSVVINLTGGTTAMQYVVETLAGEASRLGVPVRRIALVDRRPYEEQKRNPFVAGDLIDVGSPKES